MSQTSETIARRQPCQNKEQSRSESNLPAKGSAFPRARRPGSGGLRLKHFNSGSRDDSTPAGSTSKDSRESSRKSKDSHEKPVETIAVELSKKAAGLLERIAANRNKSPQQIIAEAFGLVLEPMAV